MSPYGHDSSGLDVGGLGFFSAILSAAASVAGSAISSSTQPSIKKVTIIGMPADDKRIPLYLIAGSGILVLLLIAMRR